MRSRRGVPDPENRGDLDHFEETKTKQAEAWEHDINVIIARYSDNPDPRIFNAREAQFGDVSSFGDYQRCMEVIKDAEASFGELPALVRDHFKNDPGQLVAAVFDPERRAELEQLGLVIKRPASGAGDAAASSSSEAAPKPSAGGSAAA